MTNTFRCDLDGEKEVQRALRQTAEGLGDLEQARNDTSQIVTAAARGRAPRRTGRLAASGAPAGTDGGAGVIFSVPYANPIHWGWRARNIRPQPFALQAAEQTQPIWLGRYEANIGHIIRKEGLDG